MNLTLLYLSIPFLIKFLWTYLNNDHIISQFKTLELQDKYRIDKLYETKYGYEMNIECMKDGTFEEIENMIPVFNKLYKCKTYVKNIENTHYVNVDIVRNNIDVDYKEIKLSPYQLLIGFDYKERPLIVDMRITPHLAVVGISNNGKTKCVETILKNLIGSSITILNSMENDFKEFKENKINGEDNIIDYLYHLSHTEEKYEKPYYVVIDEYNVLSHLKGFDEIISDLLRQARHKNIFIILIAQQLQLEYCSFRDLFNARLCFRQLNKHAIYSFIGQTVENTDLKQREFILLHQELVYGKSYKISQ